MDDLLSEFIAETRDTLEALSGEVIAWEADPDDRARLDSIFRFVHTVKGSCGFLDLPRFERLSHAAEDVLSELRAGERKADAALVSAVLAIIDRIGELAEALDSGEPHADGDDAALIAALHADAATTAAVASNAAAAPGAIRAPTRSIRIPLEQLDRMMSGVSDMVLARNELSRRLREIPEAPGVEGAFERLSACVAEMRDSITRTRMQRIDKLFAALPRMVRDVSGEVGKQVDLEIDGSDVELDREMIELMRDPLTHIVRNAIDHGIETPEERRRLGKPAAGRLTVSARQSGNQIVIDIMDDGRGIDEDKLVNRAIAAGLIGEDTADALPAQARVALIFEPGLSTADSVSAISGRGVGMDVVKSNIERIGGAIDIDNRPRIGLHLTIRVPLTLTIIAALTVTAGNQGFAIPRSAIDEIVHDSNETIRIDSVGSATIVTIRGRALPLVNLEEVLGMGRPQVMRGRTLVVVRAASGCSYALAVAAVHDHEELVIKPASPAIMATGAYAGKSLPDSGIPMLLLDVGGLAALAGVGTDEAGLNPPAAAPVEADAAADVVPTLLFRDFDGIQRGIRLSVVERLEDVSGEQIRFAAGRMRIAVDGRILPLAGCDAMTDRRVLKILRLNDGAAELAYAIDDVIDIVALPTMFERAASAGPVAGVALVDGEQVELLDPHWLFADIDGAASAGEQGPLCLLMNRDDPWMREILRPLIEAAGYRVAFAGEAGSAEADVVIAPPGEGAAAEPDIAAPVVRLRADRPVAHAGDDSVYRYDRAGLLAAIQATVSARRA
ncbi:MAG: chemotaxis protein CheA [Sphingomonas sp. SCN 67-18]|uniref:chemotaxis protein CheA n=1 Tax=uncultured Sphingomonas sp. TaxID=158754 RepID=UPI00086BEA46|nr:chemotaxis protein CheW [Sphingomonas sp. SCN 67-18]ODU21516.1 MAG: chemotaxis protein CheA [Sphingomonas sp. SCN 67-18]